MTKEGKRCTRLYTTDVENNRTDYFSGVCGTGFWIFGKPHQAAGAGQHSYGYTSEEIDQFEYNATQQVLHHSRVLNCNNY